MEMLHTIFFFFKGFIDRPFGWCVDLKAAWAAIARAEVGGGAEGTRLGSS